MASGVQPCPLRHHCHHPVRGTGCALLGRMRFRRDLLVCSASVIRNSTEILRCGCLPRALFRGTGVLVLMVLFGCLGCPTKAIAATVFLLTEPSSNTILHGESTFAVSTTNTTVASVEFDFGSKRLGIVTSRPFQILWNTGYASDGSYALQAIGRNAKGATVETASTVISVDNIGNSMTLDAPDLSGSLSVRLASRLAEQTCSISRQFGKSVSMEIMWLSIGRTKPGSHRIVRRP